MSVYKTSKSPYYQYDFQRHGRRYHGSTGCESKVEAKRFERELRKKVAHAAAGGKRASMTLNEATATFYQQVSHHEKTADTQYYQLANLCRIIGKDTQLDEIGDPGVADFVARRRAEEVRPGRLISRASVNREVQLLRRVMRRGDKVWKTDVGEMPDWPAHILEEPKGRTRFLRDDEEPRFFEHLREDFHPLALFCLMTGVRQAGAIGLTWDRVDFKGAEITVFVKTHRPEPEALLVPTTGPLRALLAMQVGGHAEHVFTYVCKKSRGDRKKGQRYPFTKNGWRRDWKAALEAAGIDDFKFHDLRHTAATRTLKNCRNLKLVQQMLGHASITSTARYAHVLLDDVRAAMEETHSRNSPGLVKGGDAKALKGKA